MMDILPVFLHIPKTAGTAMRSVIEKNVPPPKRIEIYRVGAKTLAEALWEQRHKVESAEIVTGHIERRVHDFIDRPVRYFTILRDPIERVVSLYKYIKVDFTKHPLHAQFNAGKTLDQWIRERPRMASNVQTKMVSGLATEYEPSTPYMLSVAKGALHNMAAVGVQERFNESVDAICSALGWTPVYENRNRSSVENRAFIEDDGISEETLALIREMNQLDAALYAEGLALLDLPRADLADPFEDEIGEDREAA